MAGVSGDFRALDALVRKLGDLGPEIRTQCAEVFAEQVRTLVVDGFEKATAPDGSAWQALSPRTVARRRKRGKGARPLLDTGRLRNSLKITHDANGVYVSTPVVYAAAHNFGHAQIPARQFLPGGALPSRWRDALDETARDLMKHFLK